MSRQTVQQVHTPVRSTTNASTHVKAVEYQDIHRHRARLQYPTLDRRRRAAKAAKAKTRARKVEKVKAKVAEGEI